MSNVVKVASVIDQVVAEAQRVKQLATAERLAVKTAATAPVSGLARGLKDLSQSLRAHADVLTYEDLR